MDEISMIKDRAELLRDSALDVVSRERAESILAALARLESREAELIKDRDYWQALAMQFHDAVHAEIERRAKVEI